MCVLITYITDGSSAEVQFCKHAQLIQHTIDNELTCHPGTTRKDIMNDEQLTFQRTGSLDNFTLLTLVHMNTAM